jgi:hypothetical protein
LSRQAKPIMAPLIGFAWRLNPSYGAREKTNNRSIQLKEILRAAA